MRHHLRVDAFFVESHRDCVTAARLCSDVGFIFFAFVAFFIVNLQAEVLCSCESHKNALKCILLVCMSVQTVCLMLN